MNPVKCSELTDLQFILPLKSFIQCLSFLCQLFLQDDNCLFGERNVLHVVLTVPPGEFSFRADKIEWNVRRTCALIYKYPVRGFKGFKVLTFSLVQLLLHDLDCLSELQNMIRLLLLTHVCQELVSFLTTLQKLLQNEKEMNEPQPSVEARIREPCQCYPQEVPLRVWFPGEAHITAEWWSCIPEELTLMMLSFSASWALSSAVSKWPSWAVVEFCLWEVASCCCMSDSCFLSSWISWVRSDSMRL